MPGRCYMAVRLLVVLAFLAGMPVLALPRVADWMEAHLYSSAPQRRLESPASLAVATLPTETAQPSSVVPANFAHPFESAAHAAEIDDSPVASPPARDDQREIARMEAELQQLGAVFYRLEVVEQGGPRYRFIAQFERTSPLPERFQVETTHADPLLAMQALVDQVRSRRSVARP